MNPKRMKLEPYLLLLPSTIYLVLFFAWPMIQAFSLAFQTDDGQLTLSHIQRMLNDAAFSEAILTTIKFIILIIPIQFILALVMALLMMEHLRGSNFLVYIYAIPLAVSDLAAGIIWFSIFTERGYLNSFLSALGLIDKPFIFLNYTTPWPLVAIVLAEVWRATSIVFVILVAGLQSIPRDYTEAAEVFGANYLARIRHVILPMLKPSIQVALILRTLLAVQVFAVVLALAGRGVKVLAAEAYRWHGEYRNPHMAAAYAMFILAISLITALFYLRALRSTEQSVL
jgi:multiple sugar transport system permease protein